MRAVLLVLMHPALHQQGAVQRLDELLQKHGVWCHTANMQLPTAQTAQPALWLHLGERWDCTAMVLNYLCSHEDPILGNKHAL